MARIREAEGDLGAALDLLDEAERLYVSDFSPNVRPIPALRARVWVAQGRMGEALDWAREQGCPPTTTSATCASSSTSRWPGCCLARPTADACRGSFDEASQLLERLRHAAEAGGRTGSVIEILVLQALAHQQRATSGVPLPRWNGR